MRKLSLTEYSVEPSVKLSAEDCDALRGLNADVTISPSIGSPGCYDLTPSSWIGAIELPNLTVQIRPKIAISRILFLLSYAMDPKHWRDIEFNFGEEDSLFEAIIPGFIFHTKRAFSRGLLKSYRLEESALPTFRGRFRVQDQLNRHFGIVPPVEVTYDDFTDDIEENRLIKAALHCLERMPIRSIEMRHQVRHFKSVLHSVELIAYDPRRLPTVYYTRLNHHYRGVIELAKLILRSVSYDLKFGTVSAAAFLVDMNDVFEKFVWVALREALRLSEWQFPSNGGNHSVFLDRATKVSLKPDLSWWEGPKCVFVGDAKYKRINVSGVKHPDLYQLLAYTIATGLPGGLLCYAAGEGEPAIHEVVDIGKQLQVTSVDLSGDPKEILSDIERIAVIVRGLRARGYLLQQAS